MQQHTRTQGTNQLQALSAAQGKGIVGLVPLTERSSINLHNAILHQGLGSHQLVVAGIVDNIQDTGLAGLGYKME